MPFVNSFFGLELTTGARAAGIYTLLISFPLAAEGYLHLKALSDVRDDEERVLRRHNSENTEFGINMPKDSLSGMYTNYRKFSMEMGVSYLCCSILLFFSSIFLLVGVSKERPQYTLPWLLTDALATLYFLYRYIYIGFVHQVFYAEEPIIGAILLFIAMYFFLVVYSYKQQLSASLNRDVIINPNEITTPERSESEFKDLPPPYSAYFNYSPPPSYSQHAPQNPPPYAEEQAESSTRLTSELPTQHHSAESNK